MHVGGRPSKSEESRNCLYFPASRQVSIRVKNPDEDTLLVRKPSTWAPSIPASDFHKKLKLSHRPCLIENPGNLDNITINLYNLIWYNLKILSHCWVLQKNAKCPELKTHVSACGFGTLVDPCRQETLFHWLCSLESVGWHTQRRTQLEC